MYRTKKHFKIKDVLNCLLNCVSVDDTDTENIEFILITDSITKFTLKLSR